MNHPAVVLTTAFVVAVLSLAAWHWRDAWWPGREAAPRVVAPADEARRPAALNSSRFHSVLHCPTFRSRCGHRTTMSCCNCNR